MSLISTKFVFSGHSPTRLTKIVMDAIICYDVWFNGMDWIGGGQNVALIVLLYCCSARLMLLLTHT